MAPRRRKDGNAAARLPARRLPLGTPPIDGDPAKQRLRYDVPAALVIRMARKTMPTNASSQKNRSDPPALAGDDAESSSFVQSLADAKLKRQIERIERAEAAHKAVLSVEDAARVDAAHADGADLDAVSLVGTAGSEGGIELVELCSDVRQPRQQYMSASRSTTPVPQDTPGAEAAEMVRSDSGVADDVGFQLYTGRRHRRAALASDLDETKKPEPSTKPDKHKMYQVFGKDLPGPDFLQQAAGVHNGQVMFVRHPNGDVAAHQWIDTEYQWVNIGQYSNVRKKIEGQMATDRLKGETARQTLHQNTLAYFRTVARQREAASQGLPFGVKEIRESMPELYLPKVRAVEEEASKSASQASGHVQNTTMPASTSRLSSRPDGTSRVPLLASQQTRGVQQQQQQQQPLATSSLGLGSLSIANPATSLSRPHDDPFTTAIPQTASYARNLSSYSSQEPGAHTLPYHMRLWPLQGARVPPPSSNVPAGGASAQPSKQSFYNTLLQTRDSLQNRRYASSPAALNPNLSLPSGAEADHASVLPDSQRAEDTPLAHMTPQEIRNAMRRHLFKLGESAKERSAGQANARSTAGQSRLRALFNSTRDDGAAYSPHRTASAPAARPESPPSVQHGDSPIQATHPFSFRAAELAPRRVWTLPLEQHPLAPHDMDDSAEELLRYDNIYRLHGREPPPRWRYNIDGGTELQSARQSPEEYDRELHDWWWSGNKFARHEELFERIMAGAQHDAQLDDARGGASAAINPGTTRILIPVIENLASYVQGPAHTRRDYWCRWTDAPEWSIDHSPNGNNSFHDGEWGQPPARVGRDPRYRPLPAAGSFSPASPAMGSPAGGAGIGSGLGGPRSMYRYAGPNPRVVWDEVLEHVDLMTW